MQNIRKSLLIGAISAIMVLTITSVVPVKFLYADESSDQEEVVTASTDKPLERQAKLRRAWIVYREVNSTTVYALTKNKTKRAIQTLDFYTAFNANYLIKLVKEGRLSEFTIGDPITTTAGLNPEDFIKAPGMYRLVKVTGNTAVYLITPDGKKRVVIAAGVFHRFGWQFRDVETVSQTELDSYTTDTSITDGTVFEEEVEVEGTHKRQERERLSERLSLLGKTMIRHRLVKAIGSANVYVIDGQGRKHLITSEQAANKLKMNLHDITEVTQEELDAFPDAAAITETNTPINLNEEVED